MPVYVHEKLQEKVRKQKDEIASMVMACQIMAKKDEEFQSGWSLVTASDGGKVSADHAGCKVSATHQPLPPLPLNALLDLVTPAYHSH